eukprot:CAMPEP_0180269046 /NCGR_PEP_ID=MMETSP0988-20121125/2433_1 /TAXON_ID=697907 /ORGANISM="non described non described, Strain CCMP2293" /LENGTH=40 /DNA_ID= /DNA_START= /DNA_END= /DNA_ORIENTATION=
MAVEVEVDPLVGEMLDDVSVKGRVRPHQHIEPDGERDAEG